MLVYDVREYVTCAVLSRKKVQKQRQRAPGDGGGDLSTLQKILDSGPRPVSAAETPLRPRSHQPDPPPVSFPRRPKLQPFLRRGGRAHPPARMAPPAPAPAPAPFEPDDASLLDLLLRSDAGAPAEEEAASLLRSGGFAARFRSDFNPPAADFDGWIRAAQSVAVPALPGPEVNDAGIGAGAGTSGGEGVPKAFDSPPGARHLAATSALLAVGEGRAVSLTLAALRTVAGNRGAGGGAGGMGVGKKEEGGGGGTGAAAEEKKDDDAAGPGPGAGGPSLRSLLGTGTLLEAVRSHHHSQRLARIRVVAECLRIEQEGGADGGGGGGGGGAIRIWTFCFARTRISTKCPNMDQIS